MLEGILITIIFILFLYLLRIVYKNNGPLTFVITLSGMFLLAFPILLVFFGADIKTLKDFYSITGITGGSLLFIGLKDIITKENNLKNAGDWRKNLYKLEQKPYYTIDDLYELNSYINPYSQKNKTSIIINEIIIGILENHRGEGCVSYKNSDCNHCSYKNKCKDEISISYISYDNLRNKMIGFLKNDSLSELELEKRNDITAFDFEVNHNITNQKNRKYNTYTTSIKPYLNLTPEENNLVRLACHVLLKDEWHQWTN